MTVTFLTDGPGDAPALLLAHGAGAAMDSEFMQFVARGLGEAAIRVLRFEFPYMAGRREGGKKRPAPKAETLMDAYRAAIEHAPGKAPLIIGGKSMGGRVASMVADEAYASGAVNGLVCLGYPFHPPGQPQKLRTDHLTPMTVPALVCQGERDPFGTRDEVTAYPLPASMRIEWLTDGDHDLKPRKASGATFDGNLDIAADAVRDFVTAASRG